MEDSQKAGAGLELVATTKLPEVLAGMSEVEATDANVAETRFRIVSEMLAATTEEELWKEPPAWSSKDNIGRTFRIENVRGVFRSKFEGDGSTGFLACTAVDVEGGASAKLADGSARPTEAGEVGVLTTSALRLAARIGWYEQHAKLPVTLTITKRSETAEGYPILDGVKVDA